MPGPETLNTIRSTKAGLTEGRAPTGKQGGCHGAFPWPGLGGKKEKPGNVLWVTVFRISQT